MTRYEHEQTTLQKNHSIYHLHVCVYVIHLFKIFFEWKLPVKFHKIMKLRRVYEARLTIKYCAKLQHE